MHDIRTFIYARFPGVFISMGTDVYLPSCQSPPKSTHEHTLPKIPMPLRAYLKNMPRDIVMQYDYTGRNALYHAVFAGDVKIVRALVEYGFDPMTIDLTGGASALHFAASEGHWDIATYLVENGLANVNAADHDGKMPLEYALLFLLHDNATDQMNIAHYLIARGARFRPDMHRYFNEMKELMCLLISDIHRINAQQKANLRTRMKMEVKFMIDALNEYNTLFFNDVIVAPASGAGRRGIRPRGGQTLFPRDIRCSFF